MKSDFDTIMQIRMAEERIKKGQPSNLFYVSLEKESNE